MEETVRMIKMKLGKGRGRRHTVFAATTGGSSEDGDFVALRDMRERLEEEGANKFTGSLSPLPELPRVRKAAVVNHAPSPRSEDSRREELFTAVVERNPEDFRALLTSSLGLDSDAMRSPITKQNLLHFALENSCLENAAVLIEKVPESVLLQSYDVTLVKAQGRKNALHRITELNAVALGEALVRRLSRAGLERLLSEEVPVTITGQRPRTLPPLHLAAFHGHKAMVEFLLSQGADVRRLNAKNDTALLWAARWGHDDIVQRLLEAGAQPDTENDKGSTALYWAVRYGHAKTVQLLARGGADVTKTRKLGLVAPVVLASALGYNDILQVLLSKGADPDFEIRGGERPLHHAAREGHVTVVDTLLKHGADLDAADDRGDTALTLAAQYGRPAILQRLIQAGAKISHRNHNGDDVWHFAVQAEEDHVLQILIADLMALGRIASPQDGDLITFGSMRSPLLEAAAGGLGDKLATLLRMKLDPRDCDVDGNTFLHHAALNDQDEVISQFAKEVGVDVANKAGDTPLHLACSQGHYGAMKALLAAKAKANLSNGQGQTPLHVLARCPEATPRTVRELVDYVIKMHAWESLHVTDIDGCNALHIAAMHAKPDVMMEFQYVRLKDRDKKGNLPLHLAVREDEPEVLDAMLNIFEAMRRDANINEQNERKESVLHLAASAGFARGVARLVRLGADLSLPDLHGDTVLHRLTRAMTSHPGHERQYMKVVETVLGEAAWWWCARHELPYPGRENAQLQQLYRRRALVLLVRQTFNQADLSPLTLACHLGAAPLLTHLLMMDDVMRFERGGVVRYDITDMTPLTNQSLRVGCCGLSGNSVVPRPSGLEWLGSVKRYAAAGDVLHIPPVKLVENVYGTIALIFYLLLIVMHIVYMSLFSFFSVTMLNRKLYSPDDKNIDVIRGFLYVIVPIEPLFVIAMTLYTGVKYACMGELALRVKLRHGRRRSRLKTAASFLPLIYTLAYSLIVVIWLVLFITEYAYQDYFLAVALCTGWLYTITFTRGFRPIHYFWKMLQNMILKDVLKFLFVYLFVLLAFSLALHTIFQISTTLLDTYATPLDTAFLVFNMMLGTGELFDDTFKSSMEAAGRTEVVAKIFYICYIVLATIVLLNLLIAMMNDSYAAILAKQRLRWKLEAMQLGLDIERSFPISSKLFRKVHKGQINPELAEDEECWYIECSLEREGQLLGRTHGAEVVVELEERVKKLEDKLTEQLRRLQLSVDKIEAGLPQSES